MIATQQIRNAPRCLWLLGHAEEIFDRHRRVVTRMLVAMVAGGAR